MLVYDTSQKLRGEEGIIDYDLPPIITKPEPLTEPNPPQDDPNPNREEEPKFPPLTEQEDADNLLDKFKDWFDKMKDKFDDTNEENQEKNDDSNSGDSCSPGDRDRHLNPEASSETTSNGDGQPEGSKEDNSDIGNESNGEVDGNLDNNDLSSDTSRSRKSRSNRPEPDPAAQGYPHSIIERPGRDGQYTTHNEDGTFKQYRGSGQEHGNIPRLNVKENQINRTPDGREFPGKAQVRPPRPDEYPNQ